ncbi:MAG: Rrf2 family transcriptional regulator [Myxococcota bacterium]|nr:Rrf2 family transcriptional regulator [Myxococcota bacterium]
MRLSHQAQYAICGMFDLAYNGEGRPVQVRVIGERQGIPGRYLEQIFQRLRRARLVQGKRGPGGGYVLARPPAEITVREILEAVEGPLRERLAADLPAEGSAAEHRPAFVWAELASRVEGALADLSLAHLCRRAAADAVRRAHDDSLDYHI